ncbi:MAG: thioredoxin family protein [bacterium]
MEKVIKKKNEFIIIIVILVLIVFIMLGVKNQDSDTKVVDRGELYSIYVDETFDRIDYVDQGNPILVMVGCDTCPSCKSAITILDEVAGELEGEAFLKYIDYEEYPSLLSDYSIRVIPTFFFYDEEGAIYFRMEGVMSRENILDAFLEMGYDFYE